MRSIIPENFKSLSLVVSEKKGGHEKPEIGRISRPEVNFQKIKKMYQVHVIENLPWKFHRNLLSHLWEIAGTKMGKIIITKGEIYDNSEKLSNFDIFINRNSRTNILKKYWKINAIISLNKKCFRNIYAPLGAKFKITTYM